MLRYGFLPSDFHPLMLFLGETEDLRRFAALLRGFSEDQRDLSFETVAFMQAAEPTPIRLSRSGGASGMRAIAGTARAFTWTLAPWQAELFADMVGEIAAPGCRSGSVLLEAAPGEIPVKVSLGEYTDDFLAAGEPAGVPG